MSLFPQNYSYTAHGTGTFVKGVWTPGTDEELTFYGTVQPISGKELEALQIGRQDTGKVKIYTTDILPVSIEGGGEAGAIVEAAGKKWEVIAEIPYQSNIIPHNKYIAEYRGEA